MYFKNDNIWVFPNTLVKYKPVTEPKKRKNRKRKRKNIQEWILQFSFLVLLFRLTLFLLHC